VKRVTLFFLVISLMFSQGIHGQNAPVATLGTVYSNNITVSVPVTVTNFTDIASADLRFTYQPSAGSVTNITPSGSLSGIFNFNNSTPGVVSIGWNNAAGVTLANNAVMFTITFVRSVAGTSTPLSWDNSTDPNAQYCSWSNKFFQMLTDGPSNYINGLIAPLQVNAPITTAASVQACQNAIVEVPVTVQNFSNIGSVKLTMNYNQARLSSVDVINTAGFPGFSFNNSTPGVIIVTGQVPAPPTGTAGVSLSNNATLFTYRFTYLGGGSSTLVWDYDIGTECEYKSWPDFTILNDQPHNTYYVNGTVAPKSLIPILTCPGNQVLPLGASCNAPLPDYTSLATATGPCGAAITISQNPVAGTTVTGTGNLTVTLTATDGTNSTSCTFTVSKVDQTPPVPNLANLPILTGEASVTVNSYPTATDNCAGTIVGTTYDDLYYNTQGTFTITWIFSDGNGNVTTQPQTVIVDDITPPMPDVTPNLPVLTGQCSVTVTTIPTATDNVAGTINGTTTDPLTYTSQGTYTITWKYDDGNGNITTQPQTVIVQDLTPPSLTCPASPQIRAIPYTETTYTAVSGEFNASATDNCGGAVTLTHNLIHSSNTSLDGYIFPVGTTQVVWTGVDANNLSANCSFDVTVSIGNQPPVVTCPGNFNVNTDLNVCNALIGSGLNAVISDPDNNITTLTWSMTGATTASSGTGGINQIASQTFNRGTTDVTYIVKDAGNLTAQCTFTVVVTDNQPPVPDIATLPNLTDEASVTIATAPTATDNCGGIISATTTFSLPYTFNTQGTFPIVWTYNDGFGNIITQNQTVIIDDITAPVPNVNPLPVVTGQCSATITTPPTATDAVEGIITGTTVDPLTYNAQGTFYVTWTYNDGNGNTVQQVQTVIVADVTLPVITVLGSNPATVCINTTYTDAGATASDNCDGNLTPSIQVAGSVNTAQVGQYIITYSVMDAAGNPASATRTVNVVSCGASVSGTYRCPHQTIVPYPVLNNITVNLVQGGVTKYTAVTDANGFYSLPYVEPGVYEVISTTVKPAAGAINALDAGPVNSWGVGPQYPIETVRFKTGDVFYDDYFDAGDATRINNFFLQGGNPTWSPPLTLWTFWRAGETISVNTFSEGQHPTITVGTSPMTQDFYGLATGDFNLSLEPNAAKTSGSVTLIDGATLTVAPGDEIVLPFAIQSSSDIGAASLILDYPTNLIEILGVYRGNGTSVTAPYNIVNDQLRISWFSSVPMYLAAGEPLFQVRFRVKANVVHGDVMRFTLAPDPSNEIGDALMLTIANATLTAAKMEVNTIGMDEQPATGDLWCRAYPNPANGAMILSYALPKEASVKITLFNIMGQQVETLFDGVNASGLHSLRIDAGAWSAGAYMVRVTAVNSRESFTGQHKIMITR
jgi:hypothetical protein